jgi:hypothetical protein
MVSSSIHQPIVSTLNKLVKTKLWLQEKNHVCRFLNRDRRLISCVHRAFPLEATISTTVCAKFHVLEVADDDMKIIANLSFLLTHIWQLIWSN